MNRHLAPGAERAAARIDARYAARVAARPLTHKYRQVREPEPIRSGAACACGARSSEFSTRRLFLEHREICTGSAGAATKGAQR